MNERFPQSKHCPRVGLYAALCVLLSLLLTAAPVRAGVSGTVGPYWAEIATHPQKIVVGASMVYIKLTDASRKPVEGASIRTLVKMPTMDMGERGDTARRYSPTSSAFRP